MLVLSRRREEKIILSNKMGVIAEILVVDIRGDTVRLGITADNSISIHREEIQEEINREQTAN